MFFPYWCLNLALPCIPYFIYFTHIFVFAGVFISACLFNYLSEILFGPHLAVTCTRTCHCVKSVQMRSFFWSVLPCIQAEYEDLLRKSPYSFQIRESTDQKKLRIWALFTQSVRPCVRRFSWNPLTSFSRYCAWN